MRQGGELALPQFELAATNFCAGRLIVAGMSLGGRFGAVLPGTLRFNQQLAVTQLGWLDRLTRVTAKYLDKAGEPLKLGKCLLHSYGCQIGIDIQIKHLFQGVPGIGRDSSLLILRL